MGSPIDLNDSIDQDVISLEVESSPLSVYSLISERNCSKMSDEENQIITNKNKVMEDPASAPLSFPSAIRFIK